MANKGASVYAGIYCLFREAQQLRKKNIIQKQDIYVGEARCFLRWMSFLTRFNTLHFRCRTEKLVCKAPCKRTQYCWSTTPNIVASVCTPCWMLFRVVAQSLKPVKILDQQLPTFFCSMIADAWRINVGSVCTALPTLWGPRMRITHGLKRLMGCILLMLPCRSQHCWEILHPFSHHC